MKTLAAVIACAALFTGVVGCTEVKTASIPDVNISMKTVTQNSDLDFITFEFKAPENWTVYPEDVVSVCGVDELHLKQENIGKEASPYLFYIKKYDALTDSAADRMKPIMKDLFVGNPNPYIEEMNSYIAVLNDETTSDNQQSPSKKQYITDFKSKCYKGKNGRILEVQYRYPVKGKNFYAVYCYLEKIPYVVYGEIDETVDLSSGNIVLWVADSLKVTEHFTMENGHAVKQG